MENPTLAPAKPSTFSALSIMSTIIIYNTQIAEPKMRYHDDRKRSNGLDDKNSSPFLPVPKTDDPDYEAGLEHIDRALSLIPPLRAGEILHASEVMARVFRAKALHKLGDISGAIAEYQVCLAVIVIRLLDYHGKVDMNNDTNHLLICRTTSFLLNSSRAYSGTKEQEGASRPYFSHDERLDL